MASLTFNRTATYATLGIGHAINDCVAGFILGSLYYAGYDPLQLGIYTLLYNVVAFGGQLVVVRVMDLFYHPRKYLLTCFVLLIAALICFAVFPELAVLLSGIASAIFHVTGGTEATRNDDRAFGIGIFASPGVVGLIGGGLLSYLQIDIILPGILLCGIYLAVIGWWYKPVHGTPILRQQEPAFERHDLIMCILITVICLRSFVWDVVQLVQQGKWNWLIVLAIAAMLGKISGGFLADRIGHRKFTIYALLLSVPFLTLFKRNLLTLCIGIFLLQSTLPSTTAMLVKTVKQRPALGIALSFGLAVMVPILLFYTSLVQYLQHNIAIVSTLIIPVLLLGWYQFIQTRSAT